MTLILYKFTCRNGHEFEAAESSGDYGVFVGRGTESQEPCVVQALSDPVYAEVDWMLRSIGAYDGRSENEQIDLLQSVFGVACDPAPDGTVLVLSRKPSCPSCGTREMASWEPTRLYSGPTHQVTHQQWEQRTTSEKKELLSHYLTRETGSE